MMVTRSSFNEASMRFPGLAFQLRAVPNRQVTIAILAVLSGADDFCGYSQAMLDARRPIYGMPTLHPEHVPHSQEVRPGTPRSLVD